MLMLFGYMDILIFIKWSINYKDIEYRAPDIKSILMSIFLKFGEMPKPPKEGEDWKFFAERSTLEKAHLYILIASILCIILMLFPKMFLSYYKEKKKRMEKNNNLGIGLINNNEEGNEEKININEHLIDEENNNENKNIQDIDEPKFSDFMVASLIETIEFVLGTVSNTASYLRLWALSLAHSQLSVVFFSKTLGKFGSFSEYAILNGFLLSLTFILFALLTISVLLFMDLMECALHTLRLHWVEFQNKFYKADGYIFKPFCFRQTINLNNEEFKQDN